MPWQQTRKASDKAIGALFTQGMYADRGARRAVKKRPLPRKSKSVPSLRAPERHYPSSGGVLSPIPLDLRPANSFDVREPPGPSPLGTRQTQLRPNTPLELLFSGKKAPATFAPVVPIAEAGEAASSPPRARPDAASAFMPASESTRARQRQRTEGDHNGQTVIDEWVSSYANEGKSFDSVVLFAEMRLREVYRKTEADPMPSRPRAVVCADVMGRVAQLFKRFKYLVEPLTSELLTCVFADFNPR